LAVAALLAAAGAAAAPSQQASAGATGAMATIVVDRGQLQPDGTVVRSQEQVPVAVGGLPRQLDKPPQPNRPAPAKLSPVLAAAINDPTAPATERVIVTFQQDRKVPRFPEPDSRQPRSAAVNLDVQARSDALVASITSQRQPGYQALTAELAPLGIRTLETFWLVKAMLVEAPRSALPALARRADVAYVEPAEGGVKPLDADPANDEEDARAILGTDPSYDSPPFSRIGILDTGVRRTHVLLADNFRTGLAEDLVNPTNPNPNDCFNHGTSTASIIAGGGALGPAFRGMTRNIVDSFKVFRSDACGTLVLAAAGLGFERAVQVGDRVIVAALGSIADEYSFLSNAADAAYDAGAMVIAGTGNDGPNPGSVIAPAVAQKVLGIGAVDVKTLATPDYQSVGPTSDFRVKPDLQAPTNVETGSPQSDTATRVFTGTSAATAHAGAMAAVVGNRVRRADGTVDPGTAYAYMIATGTADSVTNKQGAGRMQLCSNCGWSVATPTIGNLQKLDFPMGVGPNQKVRLAIWWPEAPSTHNDIDLALIGPDGHTVWGVSGSVNNVFERINTSALPEGVYTVRIRGYNVQSGSQLVHLVAITTA
jgi:hypothetical protein